MTGKSALQVVLDQLEQVLRETRDRKMPDKPLPEEIKKDVDELEKIVSEFTQLSEHLLKTLGATDQEINQALKSKHQQLTSQEQRELKRSQELFSEARRKYAQLGFLIKAAKQRGDVDLGTKRKKTTGEVRRKKFRRVGGKRRWMPL